MKKHQQRHKARRMKQRHAMLHPRRYWMDLEVVPGSVHRTDTGIGFTITLPPAPPALEKLMRQWWAMVADETSHAARQQSFYDQNKINDIISATQPTVAIVTNQLHHTPSDTTRVSNEVTHEKVTTST